MFLFRPNYRSSSVLTFLSTPCECIQYLMASSLFVLDNNNNCNISSIPQLCNSRIELSVLTCSFVLHCELSQLVIITITYLVNINLANFSPNLVAFDIAFIKAYNLYFNIWELMICIVRMIPKLCTLNWGEKGLKRWIGTMSF